MMELVLLGVVGQVSLYVSMLTPASLGHSFATVTFVKRRCVSGVGTSRMQGKAGLACLNLYVCL